MKLAQYESLIGDLIAQAAATPDAMVPTELHQPGYFEDLQPCRTVNAARLREISQEIRRCLWSETVRKWAMQLADTADAAASRLNGGSRLPRWDAGYQGCAGYLPAIQ
jgi:hypothetical protein